VMAVSSWRSVKESREAAVETAKLAGAARAQVNVSEQAFLSEHRPMLVTALTTVPEVREFDVHGHKSGKSRIEYVANWWAAPGGNAWIAIKIRNVGRGLAVIGSDQSDVRLLTKAGGELYGFIPSLVVAPGDVTLVAFVDQRTIEQDAGCLGAMFRMATSGTVPEAGRLTLVVRYSELSGTRWEECHLEFWLRPNGLLEQRGVSFQS